MRAPQVLQKRERSVKAQVNDLIKPYGGAVWRYMAPASRYGMPALDYLACCHGRFLAIETKRPNKNKKPTPRQWETIKALRAAGAVVFVVRDNDGLYYLGEWLRCMDGCLPNTAQRTYATYLAWEASLGFGGAPKAPRPRRNRRPAVAELPAPAGLQGGTP